MKSSFFQKPGVTKGEWKSHHGPMNVIDFSMTTQFQDDYAAYGCVTVCTSNSRVGTITHLDTTDILKIQDFIESLNDAINENERQSKVILSGGSALKESKALSAEITRQLQKAGYQLIGKYLDHRTLNPNSKIATLEEDKVIIKEYLRGTSMEKITEISFKDGSKNSHDQVRALPSFINKSEDKF